MPMHTPTPNSQLSWTAKDGARFYDYGAARAHERMMEPSRIHHPMPVHHTIPAYNPNPHIGQGPVTNYIPTSGNVVTRRSHRRPLGGAFAVTLRLAIWAVLLVYVLPYVLQPTPEVILNARQFVSASIEDAAAGLSSPDVARSIDQFIAAITR